MRNRKKLLDKVNWYKKKPQEDLHEKRNARKSKDEKTRDRSDSGSYQAKSVLFVEQTNQGKLSKRLRELMTRITPIIGFSIMIVESTGASLGSKFPQTSLWEDRECGRESCITCQHGEEQRIPCTKKSLVYETPRRISYWVVA